MADLAVTNTFVPNTTIIAGDVNTNFSDIVTFINNRNSGVTSWSKVTSSSDAAFGGNLAVTGGTVLTGVLQVSGVTTLNAALNVTGSSTHVHINTSVDTAMFNIEVPDVNSTKFINLTRTGVVGWFLETGSLTDLVLNSDNVGSFYVETANTVLAQFKNTGVVLLGTTTNDNAAAGKIGEYIESNVTTLGSAGSSGQYGDVTSIVLSAGDWDVTGLAIINGNSATFTGEVAAAVSLYSANTTTDHVYGVNYIPVSLANASAIECIPICNYRVSVASGTPSVYLKVKVTNSGGTPQMAGSIRARRVR